jgi:hypothetical protein
LAAIIIPGQSGTYRHLQGRVTGLLTDSGQMIIRLGATSQVCPASIRRPIGDVLL